jgi:hypothetical protein
VDLRIVERTGQGQVASPDGLSSGDAVLDIAIQARVNGGGALAGYQFDVVITGESDANGVLQREKIANSDGTYYSGYAVPGPGVSGFSGMPGAYLYYANLAGSFFNGAINQSFSTFTNSAGNQEIGLITGSSVAMFGVPGLDPQGEGNPATWAGYGQTPTATPTDGATAPIDPGIGATYFGMGQFNDIYRLRYTVTNFSPRTLRFTLRGTTLQTATQFVYSNHNWRLNDAVWSGGQHTVNWAGPVAIAELLVPVTIASAGACCDGAGQCTLVEQSACAAGSGWTQGATCATPCPVLGTCCDAAIQCAFVSASACGTGRVWTTGGTCVPNPCPPTGACCTNSGACSVLLAAFCSEPNAWMSSGVCVPNSCPQPGTCCAVTICYVTLAAACGSIYTWAPGGACLPNPCPQLGACCTGSGCTTVLQSNCPPGSDWILDGTCPCPTTGVCCGPGHACRIGQQSECVGSFHRLAACLTPGVPRPCCLADFNGSGTVTVLDVFDFLRAWFAGGPYTDVDGFHGTDMSDILNFLSQWFAGCA